MASSSPGSSSVNQLIATEDERTCAPPYQAMDYCSLKFPYIAPTIPQFADYAQMSEPANVDVEDHLKRLLELQKSLQEEAGERRGVEEAKSLSLQLERSLSVSRSSVDQNESGDNVTQMKALTGASEVECRLYLTKGNDNLADACQRFFDERERSSNSTTTIELLLPNGNSIRQQLEISKTIWDIKVFAYDNLDEKDRGFQLFHEHRPFLDIDYAKPISSLGLDTSQPLRFRVEYHRT
eukprot:GHVS01016302.1.p1 GENE.GHVS01016302.1~~GHVS01016302.1.p1  ORF type:complete len:238 (-),score=38.29 GHVS01016302.1:273-986(-)